MDFSGTTELLAFLVYQVKINRHKSAFCSPFWINYVCSPMPPLSIPSNAGFIRFICHQFSYEKMRGSGWRAWIKYGSSFRRYWWLQRAPFQHCPIEYSATTEMFYIWPTQYGSHYSHQPRVATECLNCMWIAQLVLILHWWGSKRKKQNSTLASDKLCDLRQETQVSLLGSNSGGHPCNRAWHVVNTHAVVMHVMGCGTWSVLMQ